MNAALVEMREYWCLFWWNVMVFMHRVAGDDGFAEEIETLRCPRCHWEGTADVFYTGRSGNK